MATDQDKQRRQQAIRELVERAAFNLCQDILNGKNRRIGKPQLALSGGLFTCAYCGHAVTGERIRKRLANGTHRYYTYYRCVNNTPGPNHPRVRWREEALEQAILDDLTSMRMPSGKSLLGSRPPYKPPSRTSPRSASAKL